jgi:hypothetical protein
LLTCGFSVELLSAYLNTSPDLDEVLKALSLLPESSESDDLGTVVSPPRMLRGRLPKSVVSKIVAEYQAGSSSLELAAKYDIPKSSLLVMLKREGVVRTAERISNEQIEEASRLIQQGKSVAIAATELDIAVRSLYHQLKVRGLPTKAS